MRILGVIYCRSIAVLLHAACGLVALYVGQHGSFLRRYNHQNAQNCDFHSLNQPLAVTLIDNAATTNIRARPRTESNKPPAPRNTYTVTQRKHAKKNIGLFAESWLLLLVELQEFDLVPSQSSSVIARFSRDNN